MSSCADHPGVNAYIPLKNCTKIVQTLHKMAQSSLNVIKPPALAHMSAELLENPIMGTLLFMIRSSRPLARVIPNHACSKMAESSNQGKAVIFSVSFLGLSPR